ncbi:Acyl-coA dehydrogenase (fragment) [Burkholderia sp. 8Y]
MIAPGNLEDEGSAAFRLSWSTRKRPAAYVSDTKTVQKGAHTFAVISKNARMPAVNPIGGKEDQGFKTAMTVLDEGRMHIAAG